MTFSTPFTLTSCCVTYKGTAEVVLRDGRRSSWADPGWSPEVQAIQSVDVESVSVDGPVGPLFLDWTCIPISDALREWLIGELLGEGEALRWAAVQALASGTVKMKG